jgi:hypothetical protein
MLSKCGLLLELFDEPLWGIRTMPVVIRESVSPSRAVTL